MSENYEDKVLKALNLIVEQTKPQPPKSAESSEKHGNPLGLLNEDAIVHIDRCPTCRNQFKEKLRPEISKEINEKHKTLKNPVMCVGCGEIVEKETEECPTCHGRKASVLT